MTSMAGSRPRPAPAGRRRSRADTFGAAEPRPGGRPDPPVSARPGPARGRAGRRVRPAGGRNPPRNVRAGCHVTLAVNGLTAVSLRSAPLRSGDRQGPDVAEEAVVAPAGATAVILQWSPAMTVSLHAFSTSDTPFDVQAAALEDPRPHPTEAALVQLGQALMTELVDLIGDTALEDVQTILCESLIGGFHSAAGRIAREADRARDRMRLLARDFDGSEMADTDLQAATQAARAADVAEAACALIRDAAAEAYATATGEVWTPWRGSRRGSRLTAAQLEAKQALRAIAERRAKAADPGGPIVAFRGAPFADTPADASRIFDALNWAQGQWPDMALATSGARGAERLAIRWAQQKGVTLVLARADFDRHGKAAPFRANDDLIALEPVCCLTLCQSLDPARAAGAHAFGPAQNLGQQADAHGVQHLAIRARRA